MGCNQYPCSLCNTSYYSCWARCNMCGCDFDDDLICEDCIRNEQYKRYVIMVDEDDADKALLLCDDCINKDAKEIQRVYEVMKPLDELTDTIVEHKRVYYDVNWLKLECILKIQEIKNNIDKNLVYIDRLMDRYNSIVEQE